MSADPVRDTTPAAEAVRLAAIRGMSAGERLQQAFALSETLRQLALTGLRARHPELSDVELLEMFLGAPLLPSIARLPRQ